MLIGRNPIRSEEPRIRPVPYGPQILRQGKERVVKSGVDGDKTRRSALHGARIETFRCDSETKSMEDDLACENNSRYYPQVTVRIVN
jgi:hypothetical protein